MAILTTLNSHAEAVQKRYLEIKLNRVLGETIIRITHRIKVQALLKRVVAQQ